MSVSAKRERASSSSGERGGSGSFTTAGVGGRERFRWRASAGRWYSYDSNQKDQENVAKPVCCHG